MWSACQSSEQKLLTRELTNPVKTSEKIEIILASVLPNELFYGAQDLKQKNPNKILS